MDESIKAYVVDASFVLSYLLPDESNTEVKKYFLLHQNLQALFIAPFLLPFEVLNSLKSAVLRKRLNSPTATSLLSAFLKLNIKFEPVDYFQTFTYSLDNKISFYDATYVELAQEKQLTLLTLDKPLAKLALKSQ